MHFNRINFWNASNCFVQHCVLIIGLCFGMAYILNTTDEDWIKEVLLKRQNAFQISAHREGAIGNLLEQTLV